MARICPNCNERYKETIHGEPRPTLAFESRNGGEQKQVAAYDVSYKMECKCGVKYETRMTDHWPRGLD